MPDSGRRLIVKEISGVYSNAGRDVTFRFVAEVVRFRSGSANATLALTDLVRLKGRDQPAASARESSIDVSLADGDSLARQDLGRMIMNIYDTMGCLNQRESMHDPAKPLCLRENLPC